MIEVGALGTDYCESKVAKRLRARVSNMISGVDTLVAKLESERRNIKDESTSINEKNCNNKM